MIRSTGRLLLWITFLYLGQNIISANYHHQQQLPSSSSSLFYGGKEIFLEEGRCDSHPLFIRFRSLIDKISLRSLLLPSTPDADGGEGDNAIATAYDIYHELEKFDEKLLADKKTGNKNLLENVSTNYFFELAIKSVTVIMMMMMADDTNAGLTHLIHSSSSSSSSSSIFFFILFPRFFIVLVLSVS
jgi:hypothetical protein